MTVLLASLDSAVLFRYTVQHSNNHQTLTVLAIKCQQDNIYKLKFKKPPALFDKWEIDITQNQVKAE